jgi:titin
LEAIDDSAGNLSAFYKLAADIDLGGSATPWTPLTGTFTGSLDGDYHTVSDAYLSIATSSPVNIGLFGVIGSGARFTKLRLLDFDFQSTSTEDATTSFGTLAGATSGTITANEIIVENSVLSGPISFGGILFGGAGPASSVSATLVQIVNSSLSSAQTSDSAVFLGGVIGSGTVNINRLAISATTVSNDRISKVGGSPSAYDYVGGILGTGQSATSIISESSVSAIISHNFNGGAQMGGISGMGALTTSNVITSGSVSTSTSANNLVNGFTGYANISANNAVMASNLTNVASGEASFADSRTTRSLAQSFFRKDTMNSSTTTTDGSTAKTLTELETKATYSDASWKIADTGSAAVTTNWSLDDTSDPVWRIADRSSLPSLVWEDFWPTVKVSQPGALGATSPSTGSANLSWNQSSATGFTGGVSGYKIESSTNSGGSWVTEVADTGTTATTAALTGLSAGSSYIFRVSAIASGVVSSPSAQTTTALLMGTSPGAPVNLSKTFTGSNSATVSWDAPISDGGTAVTGYRAQLDTGSGFSDVAVSGRTSLITGVSLQSTWSFRVLAENIVGDSAYATISNAPPAPYSGPIIMSVSDSQLSSPAGKSLRISGQRLSGTSSLTVDGKALTIISKSDNMIEVMLPELSPGSKNIILVSSSGVLTHQDAFEVIEQQLALVSEGLGKVNVGSFNGKLVVYALGLDRARITWKVSGIWGQDFAAGNTLNRFDRLTPLKGVTVKVDIFVDGVKRMTKNVLTR